MFLSQVRREWRIILRAPNEVANPLVFFFLGISLFAIGLGGDRVILSEVGPSAIWVLVLLANLLSLDGLFKRDHADGSLEQMLLLADPVFVPVLGKVFVHWCFTGLAMAVLAPLSGLVMNLTIDEVLVLMISLLLGTPSLSLIGAIGAGLTVGLRSGGVLLALVVLPLYLPVLIFGVSAAVFAGEGLPVTAQLYWLGAIAVLAVTLAPFAVAAALKISVEQT
jgi:heme exporter protein B